MLRLKEINLIKEVEGSTHYLTIETDFGGSDPELCMMTGKEIIEKFIPNEDIMEELTEEGVTVLEYMEEEMQNDEYLFQIFQIPGNLKVVSKKH